MVFECMRCGLRFERKGLESSGTFYTLCEKCGEEALREWEEQSKVTRIGF